MPHILTLWWVHWSGHVSEYTLPSAFANLTDLELDKYRGMSELPREIDNAITVLWASKCQPLLDLLLHLHLSHHEDRNTIQHPAPPPEFAKMFVGTLNLPPEYRHAVSLMIQSGTKKQKNNKPQFLFNYPDRNVEDHEDESLDMELKALVEEILGGRDSKGSRKDSDVGEDEGMPMKKAKYQ